MTDPDNLIEGVGATLIRGPIGRRVSRAIPDDDDIRALSKAVIIETLERIREPTNGMAVAGWKEADKFGACLGNGDTVRIFTAMLTTLLASMKDPDNG